MPAVSAIVPDVMQRFGIGVVRVAWEPSLFRTTVLSGFHLGKWSLACVKHHFAGRFRKLIDGRGIAHPDAFFGTAHAGGVDLPLLRLFLASGRHVSGGADIPVCLKWGISSGRRESAPPWREMPGSSRSLFIRAKRRPPSRPSKKPTAGTIPWQLNGPASCRCWFCPSWPHFWTLPDGVWGG